MAKTSSNMPRGDGALTNEDVSDQTVSQVGKAVAQIVKLRQVLEENIANVHSDEERQDMTEEVETAARRAISDQGLSVTEYNQVISAAQSDSELEERVLSACRAD